MQAANGPAGPSLLESLLPFILIGFIFYFLLIRPQNKRMKKHRAMLDAVARGDTVVTSGGLIGKVMKVTDDELAVDLGGGNTVKVVRSMLAEVRNKKMDGNGSGKKK